MAGPGRSFSLLREGFAWKRFGRAAAGRHLLETLEGGDEQERMLAGISLVRAGDRSVDLIETAVRDESASPRAVRLLADIGSERARAVLAETAAAPGPTAEAAEEALRRLEAIDAIGEQE